MSRRSRRRRDLSEAVFERSGELSVFSSNAEALPRAQERVQQATERLGLIGGGDGGNAPIGARRGYVVGPLERLLRVTPAERFSRRVQYGLLSRPRMAVPEKVLFCQQRKERREVLFSLGVAGSRRSPGRGGSYRRRPESFYRC